MPYFPVFVDLKDKEVVVVGGGKVAERKIEKLLIFEPRIRVISPKITKGIRDLHNQGKKGQDNSGGGRIPSGPKACGSGADTCHTAHSYTVEIS